MTFSNFTMRPNPELPDLTKLQYPIYGQPLSKTPRIVYKPDLEGGSFFSSEGVELTEPRLKSTFKALLGVGSYVIEGYAAHAKFLAYDCVPLSDWNQQLCKIKYEDRLKTLRVLLNESIADYSKIIDLPTNKLESPSEVKDWYKYCLTNGNIGVSLRSMDGLYVWGSATTELFELYPRKE